MKSHGVTLQQMFTALERGNMNAGGGYIEQGEQQFIIRGVGLLRSPDDIRRVVVAERHGVPVLISDVAEVNTGYQQRQGMVGMDAARRHRQRHDSHAKRREPVRGAGGRKGEDRRTQQKYLA